MKKLLTLVMISFTTCFTFQSCEKETLEQKGLSTSVNSNSSTPIGVAPIQIFSVTSASTGVVRPASQTESVSTGDIVRIALLYPTNGQNNTFFGDIYLVDLNYSCFQPTLVKKDVQLSGQAYLYCDITAPSTRASRYAVYAVSANGGTTYDSRHSQSGPVKFIPLNGFTTSIPPCSGPREN